MLSPISIIPWPSLLCEHISSSGEYKIGKLLYYQNLDESHEIKDITTLTHLRKVSFQEIDPSDSEENNIFWLTRTRMIKNPKPKPNGRFWKLIAELHYKSEILENLLVAKVTIKDFKEIEKLNAEIMIYILGEELENDVKDFFCSLKCMQQKNAVFAVRPRPEVELQ